MKRLFDIFFSCLGLIVLSPLFVIVAFLIKCDSKGPVFFLQERAGRYFKSFKIYKFRSMAVDATSRGPQITIGGDKRITNIGKYLRKYKIDELPQLINVLKGEMSFVGPRPEVRKYVEMFKEDYKKILTIRPGITDPASIEYSEEERVLGLSNKWEEDYINEVLPKKIRLSMQYVNKRKSIINDIKFILITLLKIEQDKYKTKS